MNLSNHLASSLTSTSTAAKGAQGNPAAPQRPAAVVKPVDGGLIEVASQVEVTEHLPSDQLFNIGPEVALAPDTTLRPLPPRAGLDTTGAGLSPIGPFLQKAVVDPEAARKRIDKLMAGYDPQSSDADQIAEEIAESNMLLEELTLGERELLIRGLFDGPTSESEEDAAVRILLHGTSQAELQYLVQAIGVDELVDELDSHDLQQIQQALTA